MLSGADISDYQSFIPAGDFTIFKASEGLHVDDQHFFGWYRGYAKPRGAYHFAHPELNGAVAEAQHFLRVVQAAGYKPGDLLCLDFEQRGASPAHDAQWARDWLSYVESKTGVKPVVYTFLSFAWEGRCEGLGEYPLWIADPSSPKGRPHVPAPWTSWVLHQYSDSPYDKDVFNGTAEDWKVLGGANQAPPKPDPLEEDELYGLLNSGEGAVTPLSFPLGKVSAIGFFADNGLAGAPAVKLRVAWHQGGGHYTATTVVVDSALGKTVVGLPRTDAVSIQRLDAGTVPVAWDVS